MRILAYKGTSLVSRLIRFQTRSVYSHVGLLLYDDSVIEAWGKGVVHVPDFRHLHKPGTHVDVYDIWTLRLYEPGLAEEFAKKQVGKAYDFRMVFRFLSHMPAAQNDKWFCSELAEAAIEAGGVPLLNGPAHMHSPRDICMSPVLQLKERWVV